MAQYIFMYLANQYHEAESLECVCLWNDIELQARPDFPGDPCNCEKNDPMVKPI